jgi:hypothetical protein
MRWRAPSGPPTASRLLATLLLLACAWGAARQALGDFIGLAPASRLERLQRGDVPATGAELAAIRAGLSRARWIDPSNPYLSEYLARTALLQAGARGTNSAARRDALGAALADYRQALLLRPNSGYLWAGEMLALDRLDRAGAPLPPQAAAALRSDLARAVRLAPWEKPVLDEVMEVGIPRAHSLDAAQRAALMLAAQHIVLLGIVANEQHP